MSEHGRGTGAGKTLRKHCRMVCYRRHIIYPRGAAAKLIWNSKSAFYQKWLSEEVIYLFDHALAGAIQNRKTRFGGYLLRSISTYRRLQTGAAPHRGAV